MSSFDLSQAGKEGVYTGQRKQLDAGDYPVMISKSVEAAGKKQGSTNAVMEYTILDGEFSGEVVKEWLPIINDSEVAQSIARAKIGAISAITGVTSGGIDGLQGSELMIRVQKEPNEYINRNGQTVKGSNAVVANYMTMQMKDAEGKDVSPFVESKPKDASPTNSTSSGSGSSSISQSSDDMDDEIPF